MHCYNPVLSSWSIFLSSSSTLLFSFFPRVIAISPHHVTVIFVFRPSSSLDCPLSNLAHAFFCFCFLLSRILVSFSTSLMFMLNAASYFSLSLFLNSPCPRVDEVYPPSRRGNPGTSRRRLVVLAGLFLLLDQWA